MTLKREAANPESDMNPTCATSGHMSRWLRTSATSARLIALAFCLAASGIAIADEPPMPTPPDTVIPITDDDDAEPTLDDGSATLPANPSRPPSGLQPLSPTEERRLLGSWGDITEEAED